jgi:putative CocE/NonD family hydrolase
MAVVSTYPRAVQRLDPVWIPLKDGTRLAARVWLPVDATANPVPAILEYLPYRRREGTAERDALTHPYVAGHGYACVRVDIRGSGDSDGVLTDEYLPLEQADALEVIAWLADQSWCTGAIGMMGHSWGGFNALQVAAHRPPALRAIITSCSTDDRYADDIHAMGGCLLLDNLRWASTMFAHNSRPPDPAVVGPRWRDMWLERLRGSGLWIDTWLRHQRRDDFWKQGSVCEDYDAIQCAVFAVGGWLDAYTNAVSRLLQGLPGPRRGLIGQWAHRYPHMALPGPAVGFLQVALEWWDTWLKDRAPGRPSEPLLRAWMQESVRPAAHYATLPGRWVAERVWPSPRITPRRYVLHRARLAPEAGAETPLTLHSPETLGVYAGRWCPYQLTPDLPLDQRLEDGGALTFDTDPLAERLEILGAPVAELELAVDRPVALVAARLCDVAPDGAARRVSYGLLNLTHRESHEHPTPLEPGRRYRVRLPLNDVGQAFPAGHRIRLALATAYWPIAWPSPEPVTLTLYTGASALTLPVRPSDPADAALPPMPPAETAPPLPVTALEPARTDRVVHHDAGTGTVTLDWVQDSGRHRYDDVDLTVHSVATDRFSIRPEDPLSARAEVAWTVRLAREDWRVETRTRTVLTATRETFELEATLDAVDGDTLVHHQRWTRSIPRDLV